MSQENYVLHVDLDLTGHRSVLDLVQAGFVRSYPCRTLSDAEGVFWSLYQGQLPRPQWIVLDTITKLAEKTKQDIVLDPTKKGFVRIAENLDSLTANQKQWGKSGDAVTRLLRYFFELDIPSIFVFHQSDREDPMTGYTKVTPNAQAMILNSVVGDADAIVRLRNAPTPIQLPDGTIAPAGCRQLLLAPTADSAVGVRSHVPVPPFLIEPTLVDFVAAVGGSMPHNTVLYGPPKIGKTTLACGADRRIHS